MNILHGNTHHSSLIIGAASNRIATCNTKRPYIPLAYIGFAQKARLLFVVRY